MNKKILHFHVDVTVDDDSEDVPDIDEFKLQVERALLDDKESFGILDATLTYGGERDADEDEPVEANRCSKEQAFPSPGTADMDRAPEPTMRRCKNEKGHKGRHKF